MSSTSSSQLSDYGGDVSQYMSLLQGSSALSFSPGDDITKKEEDKDYQRRKLEETSNGKEFGGDYGDYLKLLEGNSALGFNPQTDPIADNQDLQTDVFGGGMSGTFWDMYKGKKTFDSFEESDKDLMEEMEIEDEARQTPEEDQAENRENRAKTSGNEKLKNEEIVIFVYKPNKTEVNRLYSGVKDAISSKDKAKLSSNIESLFTANSLDSDYEKLSKQKRKISAIVESEDEKEDRSDLKKQLDDFIKTFISNVPDPTTTTKTLSMNFQNLTIYGISNIKLCDALEKMSGNKWRVHFCLQALSATVDTVTGPGVPFKGKVSVIFKQPRIELMLREIDGSFHVTALKTSSISSKFVPTYDSSIPLNPWSKVSMSGYMVSKVKKVLPGLVDKTILKLMHAMEKIKKTN